MPTISQLNNGKVTGLWGTALIRTADGKMRALKLGDAVNQGDLVLTTQDGIVQLGPNHLEPIHLAQNDGTKDRPVLLAANDISAVVDALNRNETESATAAGLSGDDGSTADSLRVDRISEGLLGSNLLATTASYLMLVDAPRPSTAPELLASGPASETVAPSNSVSATEEGPSVNLGIPSELAVGLTVQINQVPAVGQIQTANGTVVLSGSVIAIEDLPGLVYIPPTDYSGGGAGQFTFTVTGPLGSSTGSVLITLNPTNDTPRASGAVGSGQEDSALPIALGGEDVDGVIVAVTVTSAPANGVLFLADGVTPVVAGQALTPEQARQLLYKPSANFNGGGSFTFTVTDDAGAVSAPGSFDLVVVAVNDAPITVAERISAAEDTPLSGNVLANDSDIEGAPLGVMQFNILDITYSAGTTATLAGIGTFQINADGSFLFIPQGSYNGPVPTVSYVVSDGSSTSSATLDIMVNPVNDPPIAVGDIVSTNEDTPVTINVTANDADVDGDRLSVIAVAGQPISIANPVALPAGVVSLNADGTLTLTPNANFNGPLNFTYTVSDSTSSSTGSVAATVTAMNDAPAAVNDLASTAIGVPISIAVLANDRDVDGDTLSLAGASVANPAQGTVSVNPDGTLQFTPAASFSGIATINYVVTDGTGASTLGIATVNVGTNTPPTGSTATLTLFEDSSRPFTAADFGFADADAGQTFTNVRIDLLPTAGSLTFGGSPVVAGQIIATGQLSNLVFVPAADANGTGYTQLSFSVQDSLGGFDSTPRTMTLDVTPVADAAVLSSGNGAVTEDGALTTGGTLTIADADSGQASFAAQAATPGSFGTFTLDAAGAWTYALNNASAAVQSLGAGQTLTETFSVAALDGTASSVTVTINGRNDAAVLSSGSGAVTEDGALTTGGTLTIADADSGQASFAAQAATPGSFGTFTLDAAGAWTYALNNASAAVQSLGAGQTLTETFSVAALDGTASSVTVTINGRNDAAVLSSGSGAVTEDGALTTGGTLTIADADSGQASFAAQAATPGSFGTFTLDAAGAWTYALNNASAAVQSLGAGQTLTETFSVAALDGTASSVTVTINGRNDAAVLSSGSGAVTEDGALTTGGTLTIADADSGQASFAAQAATPGSFGTFTLDAAGAWTYALNNASAAVQSLGAGQTLTETFSVAALDGTASSVTVTINGRNDAAVLSSGSGAVTEDGALTTGGTLTIADADSGQASFAAQAATPGSFGTFTLDAAGAWTYALNNASAAVQSLGAGQTLTETFSVAALDGTASSVTVTINGRNDAAVLSSGSGAVTEDGALTTGGTLTIADADSGQASFAAQAATPGSFGTFTLDAAGAWTYALNNASAAVQSLGAGQTLTETFSVAALDGTASSVTVTINGRNDAAVLSSGSGAVTEDGALTTGGTLTIADADSGQASFAAQAATPGSFGTFTLDAAGAWTYALNNASAAVQSLGAGQTLTETFSVAALDGTASSVTVTINGRNDAAVLSSGSGAVTEDGALTTGGTLTIADADSGQASFAAQAATPGSFGTFTLDAAGAWTYALNNASAAVQSLGAGQTLTETFSVAALDGTASSVTVTINGRNDAAVLSSGSGAVTEDGALTTGGTLTIADADSGQASFAAQAATPGSFGTFTLDAAGAWTYALNNASAAVQSLGAGQTLTETFSVAALDGTASSVTVTINGRNDAAVLSSGSGAVTEDGALTTGGTLTIADADSGQASFAAQAATPGSFGTFTLDAAGAWTYALNNASAAVQSLGAGQTLTETFSVAALDGTASSVTVTINGRNDAAVLSAATATLTEDSSVNAGNLVASGTLGISDVDTGQATFLPQSSTAGAYGTFSVAANGAWNYSASNSSAAIQALAAGTSVVDIFNVLSMDGTPTTVVVTLNGINDAPVANVDSVDAVEDASLTISAASLLANDSDVDNANVLGITAVGTAVGGTVALNLSGNIVFTPAANYSGPASFAYTISDGSGGSSTATVNVAVAAVADLPTLVTPGSVFSLQAGPTTISTEPGITQVDLELVLGLAAGQLDSFAPPAGAGSITTDDPGTVDVADGKITNYTLTLGGGNTANFAWQFFNGEDLVSEINNGYNDVVALVVTDPTGAKQLIQVTSSEQLGPNANAASVDATGSFQFTAAIAGEYQFSWLVLNGRDGAKDSSITVGSPTITMGANTYGTPVPFPMAAELADRDGSEILSIHVSGVPAGAAFSAGTDLGSGDWTFTSAQLSGLSFLPAAGFSGTLNLSVSATATETSTGAIASSPVQSVSVTIESTSNAVMGTQASEALTGTAGDDLVQGFAGNDTLNGNDGNDILYGDAGNDQLNGGNGQDILFGGTGTDVLDAGAGNDKLFGGAGNDALNGGTGADVFAWTLAEVGAVGTPATDTISDFNVAAPGAGGDLLDLRDLLQGETKAGLSTGNLDQFLDFDTTSSAGNTIIRISSSGGFAGGTYNAGAEDQRIILQGVDLRSAGAFGLNASASDSDIIQQLLQRGKLVTDGP